MISIASPNLFLTLSILTGLLSSPPTLASAASPKQDSFIHFNRDIRPIFAENCFTCHGPDHNKRMAGLRLDLGSEAMATGVLAPGKPEKSRLITRILAKNGSGIMPPLATHKKLSAAQKDLLVRWVLQGAKFEKHWSFVPLPAHILLPQVKDSAWCRNEIDQFIRAKLESVHIKPSPEAAKADWIRRVSLDLTGLPPTIPQVDKFLADHSKEAYSRVVDNLISQPGYGEKMALPWLDAARYADSYGYQSDQLCPTWPYRDWVVKAFNDNLSYDKFITWQLAGDLLPNATREQRLATAFNRLHRMTNEGGSVPEEWRLEGVADRVKTFGTAFLGLTTECAHCHDHKYDPITQKDYYALSSFFNNIDEYGLYDRADIVPSPSILLPTPQQEKDAAAAKENLADKEFTFKKIRNERESAFQKWLLEPHQPTVVDLVGSFDFEKFDGTTLRNLAEDAKHNGERLDEVKLVPGHTGNAALFEGDNNIHFPDLGRFDRSTPYTISFWMKDQLQLDAPAVVFQACDGTDAGPFGYDLLIQKGMLTARIFRHWPGNAIAVRTLQPLSRDTWTQVAVTYDGSSKASGLHIYVNGKQADTEIVRDKLLKNTGRHTLTFGQRFRDRGFKDGIIDDLSIFTRALTPLELAQIYDGHSLTYALAEPQKHEAELRDYYFSALDHETRKSLQTLTDSREKLVSTEDVQYEIATMEEMPSVRPTFVLARGRYDSPTSKNNLVSRTTPATIAPFPSGLRKDRLGLAQWLTMPDHPLTARVAVNRIWSVFFGRGLVETAEDFGIQGKAPSHPELLDWIARDFIHSGWNVKALVKKIVLSSTYRQASALRSDLREKDPLNVLLARGPSERLSAEAIRDTALAASGLLDSRRGGPPVSPYQPGDLWRESNSMSPGYQQSVGTDLYRKSLYTVWKRTAPMTNMSAFDAGTREVCIARRQTTNTPLQALVLLDDPQFVEAARVVGERVLKEAGHTTAERTRYVFRLLAVREPTSSELKLLEDLYEDQLAAFQKEPDMASKLIKIGESKPGTAFAPADLAAATVLAQTVLNLDATIWKR